MREFVNTIYPELLKKFNISTNEHCLMDLLQEEEDRRGKYFEFEVSIAEHLLGYSRATVFNTIKSLKDKGLIFVGDRRARQGRIYSISPIWRHSYGRGREQFESMHKDIILETLR